MAEGHSAPLLDTQLLLWWSVMPERLPAETRARLADCRQAPCFSVASLWEVAIKTSLGRADFQVDAAALRLGLLQEGFIELPVRAPHALAVLHLPWVHRDPFDRLLVAQAAQEGLQLITADRTLLAYGDHVAWMGDGASPGECRPSE